ncbi:MAG: hypothetical protein ANABAC_3227 [Anaerolineae bacterium]|jgi:hypothetical protein|nr:MAG: hypothetical protein ANABAC_3227 [Anaerolineae bacterium]
METIEEIILRELATLPEERKTAVLRYIRFLKLGLFADEKEIEQQFDESWERVKQRTKRLGITEEDVEEEIRLVRQGK